MPERRPRINAELAARLDKLRSPEETFEGYVNYILDEHAERMESIDGRPEDTEAERLQDFADPGGAWCYIDRLNGGWGKDRERPQYKDVIAGLVVDATEQGYDSLGVYITLDTARILRDVMTELLDEIPRPAHGARAENKR